MRKSGSAAALAAAILAGIAGGANAQQTAALDGMYRGTMSLMETTSQAGNTEQACVAQRPVNMTIKNGVVTVFYADWGGNTIHYHGNIDGGGTVNAVHTNGDGSRSMLSGRVDGGAFSGHMEREKQMCPYSLSMARSPT